MIVGAVIGGVESVSASVVRFAQVVDQVESVCLSNTSWILASLWNGSLARSSLSVEVLVIGAGESCVESTVALVVALADVVDQVESVVQLQTSWIFTSRWHCGLALS